MQRLRGDGLRGVADGDADDFCGRGGGAEGADVFLEDVRWGGVGDVDG